MVSISGSGSLPPPQPIERKVEARPAEPEKRAEAKPPERPPEVRTETSKEEPRPRVDIRA